MKKKLGTPDLDAYICSQECKLNFKYIKTQI